MAFTVTAEPTQAFVDGVSDRLTGDATLMALVTGVYAHLREASRTAKPYVVLGHRSLSRDAGAMQLPGGRVSLQIDVFSDYKGPYQAAQILSRISVLLERYDVTVTGFDLINGSLSCEMSDIVDEPDDDKPEARIYHGVQRWTAEIHQS